MDESSPVEESKLVDESSRWWTLFVPGVVVGNGLPLGDESLP